MAKYRITDNTTDNASLYKSTIDGNFDVLNKIGNGFAPYEQTTPNMTIQIAAGTISASTGSVLTLAAQNTATIVAPGTNPRIDRVVISKATGVISVVTGTESATPVAPTIAGNQIPICQIALATSTTSITNSLITDERPVFMVTGAGWNLVVADTPSGVASAQYTTGLGTAYDEYLIILNNVGSSNNNAAITLNFSDDGGATYVIQMLGIALREGGTGISFSSQNVDFTRSGGSGDVYAYAHIKNNRYATLKGFQAGGRAHSAAADMYSGVLNTVNDIDAIQLATSTGTLTSTSFTILGR